MSLANDYKGISDRVTVIAATAGNKTDKIRVAAYCRVSTDNANAVLHRLHKVKPEDDTH